LPVSGMARGSTTSFRHFVSRKRFSTFSTFLSAEHASVLPVVCEKAIHLNMRTPAFIISTQEREDSLFAPTLF
jgi:hypothetical protein